MKALEGIAQGTKEWLLVREKYSTASEAPAAMGCSKYTTRDELLHQKATGITKEVSASQQFLFDRGHAAEKKAREIVERHLGKELYPVTGVSDCGKYLASFDGIDIEETIVFEHKLWSESLAQHVANDDLPPHYYWQLEHQLMVSGASEAFFVCSDGTEQNFAYTIYKPVPGRREQLVRGWEQFHIDLANFKAADPVAKTVGRAPSGLPALRIELSGEVRASNLTEFRDHALSVFAGINRDLKTDSDFADAEQTVKWCADVEQRLEAAKQNALSQTATIDALFRTIDDISAEARKVRLDLDKLVKARKESIKLEIVNAARAEFTAHIGKLNARLGGDYMPMIAAGFGDVIKSKRTVESIQSAVNDELARVKIEALATADRIDANIKSLKTEAHDWTFLFPDLKAVCAKEPEDFGRLVAERQRLDLERQAAAKPAAPPPPVAAPAPIVSAPVNQVAHPSTGEATLRIGDISSRLGINVTADLLASLGVRATIDGAAKRYSEAQFQAICQGLVNRILNAQQAYALEEVA